MTPEKEGDKGARLCKDCRYYDERTWIAAICNHPAFHDMVDGTSCTPCIDARSEPIGYADLDEGLGYGRCGPQAKLFERATPRRAWWKFR